MVKRFLVEDSYVSINIQKSEARLDGRTGINNGLFLFSSKKLTTQVIVIWCKAPFKISEE